MILSKRDNGTAISRRQVMAGAVALAAAAGIPAGARAAAPLQRFRPAGAESYDHAALDALLSRHVKVGSDRYNRVDYRGLAGDRAALKASIAAMQAAAPSRLSGREAHAWWINLYNAATLDIVLEHYPVRSIRDINLGGGGLFGRGPWSRALLEVEGEALSLDDIEHRIVLPIFGDPMSHYALNCASYSCPNLAGRAFTGADLDAMMARNAADYVNHARGVSVDGGRISASRIYSWYEADFGGRAGLKPHWLRFAEPAHGAAIEAATIGDFAYDWSLNDV